jgi:hypothetical protein
LKQRLPFRGHDENIESYNQGNLLELLKWFANRKKKAKQVVLESAPEMIK